jgi:hypothetical protein
MCRVPHSSQRRRPKISTKDVDVTAAGLPLSRFQDRIARFLLEHPPGPVLRGTLLRLKERSPWPLLRGALLRLKERSPWPALRRASLRLLKHAPRPALRRPLLKLLDSLVLRPGIASRLAIAFVAVALLAVAANLIVEHG